MVTEPFLFLPEALAPKSANTIWNRVELAHETPYYALFCFTTYTGCRRSEVLGLRWQDVDLDKGTVSILQTSHRVIGKGIITQPPKSAKGRRAIALDPETVTILRAHRANQLEHRLRPGEAYKDNGLVFPGPFGELLEPAAISRPFRKLADNVGLKGVRFHDLRHFHATALLQAGTHPKVVQERLGHSTISVTLDTYSHVLPGLQEQAALAFAATMKTAKKSV
ncbi:MAG: site-specific integrase [Chloroflexi bacterium]|nr:site-specific integrase [Chloroflexota bacterium]